MWLRSSPYAFSVGGDRPGHTCPPPSHLAQVGLDPETGLKLSGHPSWHLAAEWVFARQSVPCGHLGGTVGSGTGQACASAPVMLRPGQSPHLPALSCLQNAARQHLLPQARGRNKVQHVLLGFSK